MAVGQNPVPLVSIKIGGKWMFIHPKMGSPYVGYAPWPYVKQWVLDPQVWGADV